MNNSGAVDITDALLTARYSAGLPVSSFHTAAADVNCSGGIDITDALRIAQYSAKRISSLGCAGVPAPVSVLYVMHYLAPETSTTATLDDIKNSGFDTCIIFSIDGTADGNLIFYGTPIFTNGNYVGPAGWKASYGITSAGAWQYSDMRDFGGGTAAQFNTAIRNGLK